MGFSLLGMRSGMGVGVGKVMLYLKPSFTVPAVDRIMPGTCERCVYGTGRHAAACTSYISAFDRIDEIVASVERQSPILELLDRARHEGDR
jgi:hypothetical protein